MGNYPVDFRLVSADVIHAFWIPRLGGKRDMVPVVLLDEPGGDYWRSLHDFVLKKLLGRRM